MPRECDMARSKPKRSPAKKVDRQRLKPTEGVRAQRPGRMGLQGALAAAVLGAAIVFGGILRVYGASASPTIINDEGISLLAATGHQGEYAQVVKESRFPYGSWCKSAQWRRFILPERRFCFGTISSDLARYDLHPPLYFWFLHVWLLIWGLAPSTALSLNLIFFAASAVGLFLVGVYALGRRFEAAAAVMVWSCSPNVIPIAYQARQYELLALCTIWFTLAVLRCTSRSKPPKTWHWIALGLISGAGLLVHYHFVIALTGGGVYTLLHLARHHRGRLALGLLSIYMGAGLANVAHPVIKHVQAKSKKLGSQSVSPKARLRKCSNRYRAFLMDDGKKLSRPVERQYSRWFPYVFGGLCAAMAALGKYRRVTGSAPDDAKHARVGALLFFLIWYAAGNIALYVSGLSPPHAMAAKYPCMAWPFAGLLLVILTRPLLRWRVPVQLLLCGAMALSGSMHVRWDVSPSQRLKIDSIRLPWFTPLIVDDASRLRLPRLLFRLGDDVSMLVAHPNVLLSTYDQWSAGLAGQNRYLGYDRSGKVSQTSRQLFGRLQRDFVIENGPYGIAGYNIYVGLSRK